MRNPPDEPQALGDDAAQAVLALLHRLLLKPASDQPGLEALLAELASVFRVTAVGLAELPTARTVARYPITCEPDSPWPWQEDPTLLEATRQAPGAVFLERAGCHLLATAFSDGQAIGWVLWLEGIDRPPFTEVDAAALSLTGQFLAGRLRSQPDARWVAQLDRANRLQRLETAADVTRRLAHDFGNVLTGILGFTELALTQQVPANTALHSYLTEVHRAAQSGAQFTHQLRLFSRRQSSGSRCSHLPSLLAEEEARLFTVQPTGLHVFLNMPENLPAVAIDPDNLHQILGAVLDNAREALQGAGAINITARQVELTAADCQELYGNPQPGPHIEVVIVDTGSGLTAEASSKLFSEPFFTTKARRRGFGLMVVYGILQAQKGGIRLHPGEECGVVTRLLLPISTQPIPPASQEAQALHAISGERLLVVDDEPEVLNYVASSLERGGYRVTTATSADKAMQLYLAQSADPYRLVITDVVMPGQGGVELVRRLLKRDPKVRVLFMSGHATPEVSRPEIASHAFELLAKPFRPDQLVKAVQGCLNRTRPVVGQGKLPSKSGSQPSVLGSSRK
ncbi:MAG: response regulator [Gemmataceae bacterium]